MIPKTSAIREMEYSSTIKGKDFDMNKLFL